jgi:hypothetical protein
MSRETLLQNAARFGYAARGVLYVVTGLFAILAAIERRGATAGTQGALAAAADWPLGRAWLVAAAIGLACFAGWRVIQAVFDPDGLGRDRKGWLLRAGKAISAVLHLGLAYTALQLLDALEDLNEETDAQQEAAQVLALPYGDWLLLALAALVLAAAAGNVLKAIRHDFQRELVCPERAKTFVEWSGRFGYMARGLVLALLAAFLAVAAHDKDPSAAKSIGGALQALERQPFGSTMVAVLGAGFLTFGAYGLLQARFRRIRPPAELT